MEIFIEVKGKHILTYTCESFQKNPLIDNIKGDLDLHIVNQTLSKLNKVLSNLLSFRYFS